VNGPGDAPLPRRRRLRGPDRGPVPLGEALEEAVARMAPPRGPAAPTAAALGSVFSHWEEIAGPALARHTRPVRLAGGVLVVAVDRPAWATQVRSLGRGLLARVGEVSGEVPESLQVVVRPAAGAPPTPPGGGAVG
jgi:predicted nucleic acid-binding Zn ribbon protein